MIIPLDSGYISFVTLPALTVGAAPIPGTSPLTDESLLIFQIYRNATDGDDTYDSDVLLIGANVYYNTDTYNDD